LYRGVHAGHPASADAKTGIVTPGDICGTVTPEEHNAGFDDVQRRSPYTSFTRRYEVALAYATRAGFGGIILVAPTAAPNVGDAWHWEWSPDEYYEDEVLLFGRRGGLGVIAL